MDKTHPTTSANESDMPTTETAESLQDKIFGLPELCENILLQLNDSKITLRGVPLDDPIKQLFVLQRVSRTFKGTIEGSRKLRKLMWLVSVNATPCEMQDSYFLRRLKICPLGWLLYETSCCAVMDAIDEDELSPYVVQVWKCLELPNGSRLRYKRSGFDYQGASWRNMKALLVHSERDVNFQLSIKESWREGRYPQYEQYTRELRVREEHKLSVVFDWIQELDRERPAKRRAQARYLEPRSRTSASKIMRKR